MGSEFHKKVGTLQYFTHHLWTISNHAHTTVCHMPHQAIPSQQIDDCSTNDLYNSSIIHSISTFSLPCARQSTPPYSAAAKSFITVHNRTMFHWLCIEILGVLSFLTSWMYTITSTFFQRTPKYNYFWFLFGNSISTCIVAHFHLGLLFFTDTLTVLYIHVYLSVVIVLKKMICSSLTLCGTTMLVLFCVQHNVLQNFNTVNSACITLWHSCIFFIDWNLTELKTLRIVAIKSQQVFFTCTYST